MDEILSTTAYDMNGIKKSVACSSSLLDSPVPAMAMAGACAEGGDVVLRRNSTEMAAFLNDGFEIRYVDEKVVS